MDESISLEGKLWLVLVIILMLLGEIFGKGLT